MKKIDYDSNVRKFYYSSGRDKNYLSCGTKVKFKLDEEEKTGTIEYSNFISRGYFISIDGFKNYIPLFVLKELSLEV